MRLSPISPRSRPRSAPGVSVPLNRSMATMPVGEVTLISVSHSPPITSMPTKSSPRRFSSGRERGADLLLARGQLGLRRLAADREVGADLALAGDAVDRAHHLAVDEDDALVALRHAGKEGLDHVRLAIGGVEHLDQRGEILRRRGRP